MIRQKDELRARPVNLGATKACLLQQLAAAAGTDEVAKIEKELERLSQLGKRDVEEQQQKQAKIGNINKRNKVEAACFGPPPFHHCQPKLRRASAGSGYKYGYLTSSRTVHTIQDWGNFRPVRAPPYSSDNPCFQEGWLSPFFEFLFVIIFLPLFFGQRATTAGRVSISCFTFRKGSLYRG